MSKESIAQALAVGGQESADRESAGGQESALPAVEDGEESIGLRLIREVAHLRKDATALREEVAHLRKVALRTELALHQANHENDELRVKVSYWRAQSMNPPALRPLTDMSPLALTDPGSAADGYGVGGQESALTAIEEPWTRRQLQDALRAAGWRRLPGPTAAYVSPDDPAVMLNLDEFRRPFGVLWRYFAGRRELPATTRPPF